MNTGKITGKGITLLTFLLNIYLPKLQELEC